MTTQTEFLQAHAVDGKLSDEHMAQMLLLPQGDSGDPTPQSGTPEPTAAPVATPAPTGTPPVETPAPTPEPVILAKDGVHTIKYEKLVEARNEAKTAQAEAEALRQQLAAAQAAPVQTPAPTAAPVALADVDFGDFSDEALRNGIEKLVEQRVAAVVDAKVAEALSPLERRAAENATTEHFTTIYTAHPNLDAMLESQELESWITSQPSYAQGAIRAAIEQGTAAQVVEVFDSFVKATVKTPEPTPAPTAQADVAKAAAKAVADAAAKPPSSLTEIPGSKAHHDEAEAMLDMSATALMSKFEGKSPAQIEALLARLV